MMDYDDDAIQSNNSIFFSHTIQKIVDQLPKLKYIIYLDGDFSVSLKPPRVETFENSVVTVLPLSKVEKIGAETKNKSGQKFKLYM